QVDPSLSWPAETVITNTVEIGTSSLEQYQVIEMANVATATLTIQTPDVAITKAVTPTGALENGDWLTFTLVYSNAGPATASNVVITDALPSGLTNASYTSVGAAIVETGSFSYTWQVADLTAGQGGIITITAQITNTWPLTHTLVNTATISALFDHDPSNNQAAVMVPLTGPTVYLPLVLRNY
ncbi:MAG: DUF11 domain-containing protein, partial [Chloroflexi bacterium]|nr:DUF11 domain-containing protein [Chloroflexota bacterium]